MSAEKLAQELHRHRVSHVIGYALHCVCDPEVGYSPDVFLRHQAQALVEAGFGGPAESVADLESVVTRKAEDAQDLFVRIADMAVALPLGCDDVTAKAGRLLNLKTDTELALRVLNEISGLREGIRRIAT